MPYGSKKNSLYSKRQGDDRGEVIVRAWGIDAISRNPDILRG
jgi:hypothetical protein